MRAPLVSAVVVAALATAVSAGCGGGETAPSPEDVKACLESGGADVMAPPLGRFDELKLTLASTEPSSFAFTGLPSGAVATLGFYETDGDAAAAQVTLASVSSIPGAKAIETELHGDTLVAWQTEAREGDQVLLASCLESGGESDEGTADDPVSPLGCVRVFLASDSTPADARRLEAELRARSTVREVRFVSKKEALAQMRRRLPELTKNLKGNPLPDAFHVSPRRGELAPQIAAPLRDDPKVDIVRVSSLPCSFGAAGSSQGP